MVKVPARRARRSRIFSLAVPAAISAKTRAANGPSRLVDAKSVMTHFVMIGAVEAVDFGPEGGNLSCAHRKYGTA
jgi:hypothetical protein